MTETTSRRPAPEPTPEPARGTTAHAAAPAGGTVDAEVTNAEAQVAGSQAGVGNRPDQGNGALARSKRIARQFLRFGLVGASGFLVNQAVFVVCKKFFDGGLGYHELDVAANLLGTQFNIRWYHVFSVIAFVVANVWNFVLNRYWTFGGMQKQRWWIQLPRFMAVGVFGLLITLVVSTALVNPESPIALSPEIFDGSSGLRTRAYWGNFIGVIVAVPANFLFNKLWTFRGAHEKRPAKQV